MPVFTVQTLDDSGVNATFGADAFADQDGGGLSLREALHWAQDGDEIIFSTTGTITLTAGLSLTQDVTINGDTNGDNKADITISGDQNNSGAADSNDVQIFSVSDGVHAGFHSLTLTRGFGVSGGAISAANATVDIINSTVSDNRANIVGGGVRVGGTLNIIDSTISNNIADFSAGGVYVRVGSTATIVNSTISGNVATSDDGGGIGTGPGVILTIANSTVVGNSSGGKGGGLSLSSVSTANVTNTVFHQNTGSGHADIAEANSTPTVNANSSFFSTAGGLTIDSGTGNLFADVVGAASLGALADNGGTVKTHAILAGSPLIGAGNASLRPVDTFDLDGDSNTTELLPRDANGNARVLGSGLDIGASEFALTVTTASDEAEGVDLATDRADGNGLSLREAIFWAATDQSIGFASSVATIFLQDELDLTRDITIDGGNGVTISGDVGTVGQDSADVRIFDVSGSGTDVTLRGLTLTGGRADSSNGVNGGAILTAAGTVLTLVNSTVRNSVATNGAGIYAAGTLNIANSTLHGNTASSFGGGIYAGANATLVNTTLTANSAAFGGGIDTASPARLNITSSTISGNSATSNGGGIDLFGDAEAIIYNSIVAGNTGAGSVDISKTIPQFGSFTGMLLASFNVLGTAVVVDAGTVNSNTLTNDPMLGGLGNNGGTVLTLRPDDGSAANGRGNNSSVPLDQFDIDGDGDTGEQLPTDAHGALRIVGTVDAGAYERSNDAPVGVNDVNGGDTVKEDTDTTASGNVLTNDTDFNIGDTKTVNGLRSGSEAAGGGFGAVGTVTGIYGSLTLNANGTWTYTLNNADPDTNALAEGVIAHDFFTYRVTDTLALTDIAQLDITITGANDHAPIITSNGGSAAQAVLEVNENTTAVTTVTSTDIDGPARTYSISGNDAALFAINATTGVLTFLTAPDAEAPSDSDHNGTYFLAVMASDGDLSDTQELAVLIGNLIDGHTIVGHKTKADTIDRTHGRPFGNFATDNEDSIDGSGGNDTIKSLGGDDTVKGGLGVDNLDGGLGRDIVDFSDKTASVELTLKGNTSSAAKVGGVIEDTLKKFESVIGGKAGDKLTGDSQNNVLSGNAGDDTLSGGKGFDILIGGRGADSLTGGAAFDRFVFNTRLGSGNVDKITDFKHDGDVIELDDAIFAAIGPTLEAGEFFAKAGATAARQADDRIIYNKTTGALYYDADGKGGIAAVLFATLATKPGGVDAGDVAIV